MVRFSWLVGLVRNRLIWLLGHVWKDAKRIPPPPSRSGSASVSNRPPVVQVLVIERTYNRTASLTGLVIAWGGTLLLISPPAQRLVGDPAHLPLAFVGQALMWVLAAAIVAIVLFWERQPLASLWLKPLRWQSIAWGLVLLTLHYAVLFPVGEWVRHAAGLPGFSQGMEPVMRFPVSYRIVAAIGAGVVEELLFRGYISRHHRRHGLRTRADVLGVVDGAAGVMIRAVPTRSG